MARRRSAAASWVISSTSASPDEPRHSSRGANVLPRRALIVWVALVAALITLSYASDAAAPGAPDKDLLYRYSTAVGAVIQYALIGGVVFFAARGIAPTTLGFMRPGSWLRAGALTIASLLAIWTAGASLNVVLKAGEEQGLVPDDWDPSRAGPFVANFVVIAVVAPIVEETTYRGLGFAAVSDKLGPVAAIWITALAFGLSHGLLIALPVLAIFGGILAWLRWRTDSLYPPIMLHAVFNATALLASVTFGGGL